MNRRTLLVGGATMFGATGCGYILYPSRSGRRGGSIDIPVLIIDVLWFIPGLVPGLVCLIVDFATGCIYGGGDRVGTSSSPSTSESRDARVEIELDGEVVAVGHVTPDRKASLQWRRQVDEATLRARAQVTVRTGGSAARAEVSTFL